MVCQKNFHSDILPIFFRISLYTILECSRIKCNCAHKKQGRRYSFTFNIKTALKNLFNFNKNMKKKKVENEKMKIAYYTYYR